MYLTSYLGLKRRGDQVTSPEKGSLMDKSGKILGKTYFRDPEVNKGFYSKKRDGVADVDPKVSELTKFLPNVGHGAIRSYSRETAETSRNRSLTQAIRFAQHRRPPA
jgi:hypothetical protein